MAFIRVIPVARDTCACPKPDSRKGKYFGVGTIWVCDICGSAWEYSGGKMNYDQRDGDWWTDSWKRSTFHNQPDPRPLPPVAPTTTNSTYLN